MIHIFNKLDNLFRLRSINILNRQQIKLNKLKIEKETAELKKLEQIKSQGEQLRSNGIKYEMKYYITEHKVLEAFRKGTALLEPPICNKISAS